MAFFKWSRTAASNGTADPSAPWPEGMAPSAVNDSARNVMAALAMYRDDVAGAIVTTGTNAAYLVSSYSGFDSLAHLDGQIIAFSPHTTNVDTVTLSVDSLGAKPLRMAPGVELVAGTLIQGTPYTAIFNNSNGEFYLKGCNLGNPYNVPFLSGMDFWDTIAPNSRFIFPQGQAISRTVYSAAFARWGTTFGVGDGSTTFNVPDKTGRVSAMQEASATRLTSTYFGGNSTALGAVGGLDHHALIAGEVPTITATGSGSVTVSSVVNSVLNAALTFWSNGSGATLTAFQNGISSAGPLTSTGTASVSTTSNNTGGASPSHANVQPTIVCNYIIRIT